MHTDPPSPTSTRHAQARMQQRSIPWLVVDWLQRFGQRERAAGHAQIVYSDKSSRRRLESEVGPEITARLSTLLDAYLIEADDGCIITAGWRRSRVLRDRLEHRA